MQKYKFCFWLIFVLVLALYPNLLASDKSIGSYGDVPFRSIGPRFGHELNWLKNSPLLQKEARTPLPPDLQLSQKASKVSGAVAGTGAISGYVTKAAGGGGIEGVSVWAQLLECPSHFAYGTSGADGYYIIPSLPPGKYKVNTSNDSDFVDIYWNNKPNWETPDTVVVVSNDTTTNINFSLRMGGKITGTVTLPGAPYVLADIVVIDTIYRQYYSGSAFNFTGNSVTYVIKRLPTGIYKLKTWNYQGYLDVYYNNKLDWASANPVPVTEGSTTSAINFTLSLGGTIEGNISNAFKGPLENIFVFGSYTADPYEWYSVASTDTDGNYTLTGLRSGYWKIFAYGDTIYAFEWYNNRNTWGDADSVLVTAPNMVSDMNFALEVGGSISGHVYNLEGAPLCGCDVIAYENSLFLWGIEAKSATTSHDGSYNITGLCSGDYKVGASIECNQQWYDHKPSRDQADLVYVTMPNNTPDINFNLPSTFIPGDANGDGRINSADIVYLLNYLFAGGPPPESLIAGDANCDGVVNSADVVYLINYLFAGGPPPAC